MILLLGNFAGVFSNILKMLTWAVASSGTYTMLFYYRNKGGHNDDASVIPFTGHPYDSIDKNIFYKYFRYPDCVSEKTFLYCNDFNMGFPPGMLVGELPACMSNWPSLGIYSNPAFYRDPHLPEIRSLYHTHCQKYLRFTPWFEEEIQKENSILQSYRSQGKRILAVFLRSTIHYKGFNIYNIIDEIQKDLVNYDYVLPFTQVEPFFELCKQRFQEKCICLPRDRLSSDRDWEKNVTDEQFEKEVKMSIIDVYLASQCDHVMSGASNMFLGCIFFNPTITFTLYDELKNSMTG